LNVRGRADKVDGGAVTPAHSAPGNCVGADSGKIKSLYVIFDGDHDQWVADDAKGQLCNPVPPP